jgi:hypothetical protein
MKEAKWKKKNALMGKNRRPIQATYRVNKSRGGSSQKRSG